MKQFHDNVLMAINAQPDNYQRVVEEVRNVLQEVWGIPVRCDCANDDGVCQGNCMGPVFGAMGCGFSENMQCLIPSTCCRQL